MNILKVFFELFYYIRKYISQSKSNYWSELIEKLYKSKPGLYMTETEGDDINSVCKILAPLCCSNECKNLFVNPKNEADKPSDQLCEVALALLAEVTSRSCRVLVKIKIFMEQQ